MVKVIGLGERGCGIADEFQDYPEYRIYKIDTNIKERASLSLDDFGDIQGYEEEVDPQEVGSYLRSVKEKDPVLFIVGGGEPISGASLVILEQIRDADITLVYVKPDLEICTAEQKRDDKIVFGILQEYARSGLFEKMFVIDTTKVEEMIGDVAIRDYEKSINNFIAYLFAMINYFENSDSILSNKSAPTEIDRIATLGVASLDADSEVRYLYDLEQWQCSHFYYGIPAEKLEQDNKLAKDIKRQTKKLSNESVSTGFSIHQTTFEDIMVLCAIYTKDIQAFE